MEEIVLKNIGQGKKIIKESTTNYLIDLKAARNYGDWKIIRLVERHHALQHKTCFLGANFELSGKLEQSRQHYNSRHAQPH